jgi:V/A-type H+-transporting ATPase subunit E
MSIENILERIDEEAGVAAGNLLGKAEEEAGRILESFGTDGEALRIELEQRAGKKAEEEKRRLIVNEELELRKQLLQKKREILDELYERAKGEMQKMEGKEYLDLIKGMILRSAISGNEEIIVATGQEKLFRGAFLDALNSENELGKGFELSDEPGDFSWGVVLREGRRVVDLTLDVLMDQLRERIESEIAPTLFPDS